MYHSTHSSVANSTSSRRAPGTATSDHFGLEEPDDRLGQRVVVRIATAAHRRLDARVGEALRVANGEVLRAAVAVMHEALKRVRAIVDGLLQRIECQVGAQ